MTEKRNADRLFSKRGDPRKSGRSGKQGKREIKFTIEQQMAIWNAMAIWMSDD